MPNSKPHDGLGIRFEKIQNSISDTAFNVKKQYDQSNAGKLHKDIALWLKFWYGFVRAIVFLYQKLIYPISWRLWRLIKWAATKYRTLWLRLTYKKDKYGTLQFSKMRGGVMILSSVLSLYILYGVLTIVMTLPWYFLTVKRDEVLYLSNHSAVEGQHTSNKVRINEVYEITGCETINCSDQDTVSFRVEASWFNEVWSIFHNFALYYPDYVAATVSPVVNRCTITSYGIRKKFLVRYWELRPDILQVRCLPVGLEKEQSIHNRDYR
jgi:hypothetical protein